MILIRHEKFRRVMSKEARTLRDDVLKMCITYGSVDKKQDHVINSIIELYSPIPWERAVLFVEGKKAYQAICRRTSAAFFSNKNTDKDNNPKAKIKSTWERGSVGGNRHKHIDWLEIAKFEFDHDWWVDSVDFPRYGGILPHSFDVVREEFTEMYNLFTDWLITDFSHHALMHIFDINNKYSIDLVKKCMDLIEDKSKRSVEYLLPIIEKEFAIASEKILERKDLHEESRKILNTIIEAVSNREKVDWDKIEKNVETDIKNAKMFNKVKLS